MSSKSSAEHFEPYRQRVLAERDALQCALRSPHEAQRRVLTGLLTANAETAFGLKHGFKNIRDWKSYRAAVPIRDYDALAPWIDRAAGGEAGVLSADDPVVYFKSSGSTGDSKKIPITREFMRTGFFPPYYAAWANIVEHFPEVVSRDESTLNLKHDPVSRTGTTASGRPHLGASQVDFGQAFGEPLSAEPGSRAPWGVLPVPVDEGDYLEKAYLRLRLAVEHDVRCVIGINPAMVAAVPYQLEQWWPRIVRELHDGTLGGHRHGTPNPERAAQLERMAEYSGTLRPAHVWPNFKLLFCWTTGLASLYLPRLKESFGPGVTVLPAPVAASEGFVGVALDRHLTAGSAAITAAFHEFVDADEDVRPDSTTLLFDELEVGREYHVVLSHIGGLYRYALGDVVRVVDRVGAMPRISYAGRGNRSDVAGERLRESHVVRALQTALGAQGLEVRNASCRAVSPPGETRPRYEFALAPHSPFGAVEVRELASSVDAALRDVASGYASARTAGRLDPPALHVLARDAFDVQWQARVEAGTRPAQVKDRVFERDDAAWARLLTLGSEARA
ncbi:GH3 auxin-responsive promoter family protein [Actinospica robiniae]|uniref:GH3 auxin-responsive promoter family protein n=1 Tax=Actinospica robiniae TaxID=304901 RepID=UPI0003F74AB7|nr:GH3 auxin-responsive promoter family protein [Actinospica robiniae]